MHLTHTPAAVACGSAHTGSARPQYGQGTGARLVPEPRKERSVMLFDGHDTGCTPSQLSRQGKALLQVGIVGTH